MIKLNAVNAELTSISATGCTFIAFPCVALFALLAHR